MNGKENKVAFSKPELSAKDLTSALHQVSLKLAKTNKKLVESEEKRSELLANISHDLRSPIATLRGYVEYLLSFDSLDEQEVFLTLNQMYSKLLTIDYLMNQMLLFTRLESSEETIRLEPIQIDKYLRDYYYSCKNDKKYSQRRLSLKTPNDFPHYVLLDPEMFLRVLDNLFTNALKFTTQNDEIILEADLRGREVVISVKDTGIGIDKKYLSQIFERTYMISDSRTPGVSEGCGLGLSIASSIMKSHNGKIWCDSILGKGSTFFLSIPLYIL